MLYLMECEVNLNNDENGYFLHFTVLSDPKKRKLSEGLCRQSNCMKYEGSIMQFSLTFSQPMKEVTQVNEI